MSDNADSKSPTGTPTREGIPVIYVKGDWLHPWLSHMLLDRTHGMALFVVEANPHVPEELDAMVQRLRAERHPAWVLSGAAAMVLSIRHRWSRYAAMIPVVSRSAGEIIPSRLESFRSIVVCIDGGHTGVLPVRAGVSPQQVTCSTREMLPLALKVCLADTRHVPGRDR